MTDTTCIHILHTPMEEIARRSEGERWCFVCRKRREFEHVITATIEPSYYGPNHRIECTVCKTTDGDCFPGSEREWAS